jgi:hypothetical protein
MKSLGLLTLQKQLDAIGKTKSDAANAAPSSDRLS